MLGESDDPFARKIRCIQSKLWFPARLLWDGHLATKRQRVRQFRWHRDHSFDGAKIPGARVSLSTNNGAESMGFESIEGRS